MLVIIATGVGKVVGALGWFFMLSIDFGFKLNSKNPSVFNLLLKIESEPVNEEEKDEGNFAHLFLPLLMRSILKFNNLRWRIEKKW